MKTKKVELEIFAPLLPSVLMLFTHFFTNNQSQPNPEFEKLKNGITAIYEKINKD
jgi:hypothetical protein